RPRSVGLRALRVRVLELRDDRRVRVAPARDGKGGAGRPRGTAHLVRRTRGLRRLGLGASLTRSSQRSRKRRGARLRRMGGRAAHRDPADEGFMRLALRLASAGTGATYPNPCVGAIVVRRGEVLGKGRSATTGGPHAEVRALRQAGSRARGSTVYVSLEPCA